MSRRSEEVYGRFGIHGSDAYDFGVTGKDRKWEYCSEEKPAEHNGRRIERRSPAVTLGCILCAVLLGAGLISRASLIALSNETLSLQNEIEELRDVNTRLKIRHAMLFPMTETEEYAIEVLGMQKPSPEQIFGIETQDSSAEVCDMEPGDKSEPLSIIRAFFSG